MIFRGIIRIVLAPVMIVLKLLEWGCRLAQMMSGWIFRLLGIIMLLTAFGCWGFQLEEATEISRMIVAGIVVFLLPMVGDVIIAGVMLAEMAVKRVASLQVPLWTKHRISPFPVREWAKAGLSDWTFYWTARCF